MRLITPCCLFTVAPPYYNIMFQCLIAKCDVLLFT